MALFPWVAASNRLPICLVACASVVQAHMQCPHTESTELSSNFPDSADVDAQVLPSLLQTQTAQLVGPHSPWDMAFFEEDLKQPSSASDRPIQAVHDVSSAEAADAATKFFKEQGGIDKDPEKRPVSLAEFSAEQVPHDVAVEPPLPASSDAHDAAEGVAPTGNSSAAASLADIDSSTSAADASEDAPLGGAEAPDASLSLRAPDEPDAAAGHSILGERMRSPEEKPSIAGDTGEEGELVSHQQMIPRLAFRNKAEPLLAEERRLLNSQHELDLKTQEAQQAYARLKARTYESADMSRWRLSERERLQTDLRRMEMLADANKNKAEITGASKRKTQYVAALERARHTTEDALKTEEAGRLKAESVAEEEMKSLLEARDRPKISKEMEATLRQSQAEHEQSRARAVANITASIVDSGKAWGSQQRVEMLEVPKEVVSEAAKRMEDVSQAVESLTPTIVSNVSDRTISAAGIDVVADLDCPEGRPCPHKIRDQSWEGWAPHHGGHCMPTCTWACDTPKCDEVCTPKCREPRCETRCPGVSAEGCVMECSTPHCRTVCPKSMCASSQCPDCHNQCSEPQCKMRCPKSRSCKNVCEQPQCEWQCKAPTDCPRPKCRMVCDTPAKCGGSSTYSDQMPPLMPGESAVSTFAAPVRSSSPSRNDEFEEIGEVPSASSASRTSMDVDVRSLAPVEALSAGEFPEPQTHTVRLPLM